MNTNGSIKAFQEASELIPGGVNSPVRAFSSVGGTPPFIDRGEGGYIIDIDGIRVEFENGWALVRASNTTPVLVTRFESTNEDEALHYENAINNLILQAKGNI